MLPLKCTQHSLFSVMLHCISEEASLRAKQVSRLNNSRIWAEDLVQVNYISASSGFGRYTLLGSSLVVDLCSLFLSGGLCLGLDLPCST